MSMTPTRWYTAQEVANVLEKPLEEIQAIYKQVVDGQHGKIGVAYYQGNDTPLITGGALMKLLTGKEYAV